MGRGLSVAAGAPRAASWASIASRVVSISRIIPALRPATGACRSPNRCSSYASPPRWKIIWSRSCTRRRRCRRRLRVDAANGSGTSSGSASDPGAAVAPDGVSSGAGPTGISCVGWSSAADACSRAVRRRAHQPRGAWSATGSLDASDPGTSGEAVLWSSLSAADGYGSLLIGAVGCSSFTGIDLRSRLGIPCRIAAENPQVSAGVAMWRPPSDESNGGTLACRAGHRRGRCHGPIDRHRGHCVDLHTASRAVEGFGPLKPRQPAHMRQVPIPAGVLPGRCESQRSSSDRLSPNPARGVVVSRFDHEGRCDEYVRGVLRWLCHWSAL
jgi:hypothetical protein